MSDAAWMLLGAMIALSMAVAVWRWRVKSPDRIAAMAATGLYCVTLLLAMRAGARTYPGIYHPESALLNSIFNGSWLFVELGYNAVLLAAAASLVLILIPFAGVKRAALFWVKWGSVAVVLAILGYGAYWAEVRGEMPWSICGHNEICDAD